MVGPEHNSGMRRRGFTLVDVLVSIAVVAVLVGIMIPSLAGIRETTRRVICQSNVRQVGLAMAMYSNDWSDEIPPSAFVAAGSHEKMFFVRAHLGLNGSMAWDGLGFLYAEDYLSEPGVLYCPSHSGDHPYERYETIWNNPDSDIAANYQFRGGGPSGEKRLYAIPGGTAVVSDGLSSRDAFSHELGSNVLRADVSVDYVPDKEGEILKLLPDDENAQDAAIRVLSAWARLDGPRLNGLTDTSTIASDR